MTNEPPRLHISMYFELCFYYAELCSMNQFLRVRSAPVRSGLVSALISSRNPTLLPPLFIRSNRTSSCILSHPSVQADVELPISYGTCLPPLARSLHGAPTLGQSRARSDAKTLLPEAFVQRRR